MEADFSGYATKSGLKCTDGRTIMPGAFKHQDQTKIPLVWQHMHNDVDQVLGYAVLEHRDDGTYAYGFFNNTPQGKKAKEMVEHGDVESLSIYANNLSERNKSVFHGDIKELSLVLAGANPGATIDFVNIRHGDGTVIELDDEAIIYTGLELEHSDYQGETMGNKESNGDSLEHAAGEKTVKQIFDALSEEQKNVVYYMIGEALESGSKELKQSDLSDEDRETISHSLDNIEEGIYHLMGRNAFDQTANEAAAAPTLTHDQLSTIVNDAARLGSLKESFLAHAVEYGIEDIDILFPDARADQNAPHVISRRMEWVADVLAKVKKSPFSRIKSTAVDLTADEARAKGYVKGNLKKDEIIKLLKRVTTPTTVYKKQKLDRDDIVDITELDVVAWLKGEMRMMLDEELARAVLVGDGRESDDEDKINEDHLRPIAFDDDMYAHKVNLPASTSPSQRIEAILRARRHYKGSGTPTYYTTDEEMTDMLLEKDQLGRRYYNTEAELASALRVDKIIAVEAMESVPGVVGIMVNLADYTMGADKGGQISMFDDFDIDYNQQKYLIETRVSGCLTKPKSAVVIRAAADNVVTPQQPQFNPLTNTITIPTQTGVVYSMNGSVVSGEVVIDRTEDVDSSPDTGYSFTTGATDSWVFVYNEG